MFANVTVNAANAEEIVPLVRFLAGRVMGVTLQFHYPYEGVHDPFVPSRSQRLRVLEEMIRLREDGYPVA
ncbi:MAG: hypothetical protein ACYTHM_20795, partial [Planctomycetota bacterium]